MFVQNVKDFCMKRNVKPTVACRKAGVGTSFINNIEARGQVPSVEKVQQLAQYLGVTTSELLGETEPGDSIDRDLGYDDHWVLEHYRRLSEPQREIVDDILMKHGGKETAGKTG